MNFLLTTILVWTPLIRSAVGFVIFTSLLITIFLLYQVRHRSHSLLLLIDVVFSIVYALIINSTIPAYNIAGVLGFTIFHFVIFTATLGIILFVKKIRDGDISPLSKVFAHGITIGIVTTLFAVSFTYGAERVLYVTNCDTNLILNPTVRESKGSRCIINTAIGRADPIFCNKSSDSRFIHFCKLRVNSEMVKSGNLAGCSYLKSNKSDFLRSEGSAIYGQVILDKCETH